LRTIARQLAHAGITGNMGTIIEGTSPVRDLSGLFSGKGERPLLWIGPRRCETGS